MSFPKKKPKLHKIQYSVLDLAPILEGSSAVDTYKNSLSLAQRVEALGYHRFWLAEHHGMPGIASSATSVVIGYIAAGTSRIRVGAGGIMLPNHAPLVIAEQFGTLESMYPGRIDLGLGRAPGTDFPTARALRRSQKNKDLEFPELLEELRSYFELHESNKAAPGQVRAIPGEGLDIPIWLLGSSGFSAKLAGELGLPFAFASHFAPDHLLQALQLYRNSFRPSDTLDESYAMIGVNVIVADTDEEAQWLATSQQQSSLAVINGRPGPLKPPVKNIDALLNEHEKMILSNMHSYSAIGSPATVKEKLQQFLDETEAEEMIVNTMVYDPEARIHSYELLAEIALGKKSMR